MRSRSRVRWAISRFQRIVQNLQRLLFANPLGGLDASREDAADPVRRRLVRDRAVADGKSRVFDDRPLAPHRPRVILGEEGLALAAQDALVEGAELRIDLPPHFPQRAAQRAGMLVAQDRAIGVVVDQNELGTPSDRHRKARGEDHGEAELEALGPSFAAAERGAGPVEVAYPPRHLSGKISRDEAGHRRVGGFYTNLFGA